MHTHGITGHGIGLGTKGELLLHLILQNLKVEDLSNSLLLNNSELEGIIFAKRALVGCLTL